MIIQCRQCRTKFRFADHLMEGDGVWLRCSHCQHVFFQDNPKIVKHDIDEPAKVDESLETEKTMTLYRTPASGSEKGDAAFDNVSKPKNDSNFRLFPEEKKPLDKEDRSEDDSDSDFTVNEDYQKSEKSSRKSIWKTLIIAVWIVLAIIIIPALVYYFIFPKAGSRLLSIAGKYVSIGSHSAPQRPEVVTGQVKLQDIRQRILNNNILGQIRIVEGAAVNQADYPVSRIAIKGEIMDAYAVVLGERITYAGNVLTDDELATLSEEAILAKLARPEGSDNSNNKIMPNGVIPFMIVFAGEPGGVIKTTVKTVGAERRL